MKDRKFTCAAPFSGCYQKHCQNGHVYDFLCKTRAAPCDAVPASVMEMRAAAVMTVAPEPAVECVVLATPVSATPASVVGHVVLVPAVFCAAVEVNQGLPSTCRQVPVVPPRSTVWIPKLCAGGLVHLRLLWRYQRLAPTIRLSRCSKEAGISIRWTFVVLPGIDY